jgi:anti-sigma factor RsiW
MSQRCKDRLGLLSEYLDGELDEATCAQIEAHLSGCDDCRILVDTLRQTVVLYREHGHETLPPGVRERLYAVLKIPSK